MTKRILLLQALAYTQRKLDFFFNRSDLTENHNDFFVRVLFRMVKLEQHYLGQLKRVTAKNHSELTYKTPGSPEVSTEALLTQFQSARTKTITHLQTCSQDAWEHTAEISNGEETSLQLLVQELLNHDNEHLNQIRAKLTPVVTIGELESNNGTQED